MDFKKTGKNFLKKQMVHRKYSLRYSFQYAVKGIARVIFMERSFRIQLLLCVLTVIAGFIFHISSTEWLFIILISCIVLSLEMINTAFELIIDLVTEEYKIIAEHIKDIAAGAVFIASLIAFIGGLIIFIPHVIALS